MAGAYRDADPHSSDEIMEHREDATEHALPVGDDVVQAVQSSRSSSNLSSCSANIEEPCWLSLSSCRGISEDASCDTKTVRRCGCIGVLVCKCTASSTISEQHSRHMGHHGLVAYLAIWARLGESVRTRSEHQGAELKRTISVSRQARVASKRKLRVEDRQREPQLKRKRETNSVNTPTTPHQNLITWTRPTVSVWYVWYYGGIGLISDWYWFSVWYFGVVLEWCCVFRWSVLLYFGVF